jgi:hypothetical protein
MVVVPPRQSVVAQQQHTAPQALAQGGDPGLDAQAQLRHVPRRQLPLQRGEQPLAGPCQRRLRSSALLTEGDLLAASLRRTARGPASGRRGFIECHAELPHGAVAPGEAPARQGIGHLVGQHHAPQGTLRQTLEPHHALAQLRRQLRQARSLAGGQIGADFENRVTLRQYPLGGEGGQNRRRHAPGAGTELEDLATGRGENLGALACHAAVEQVGHLGGGDEVAPDADLDAARAVVTQSRRIQGQLHEALERQPPAGGGELLPDQPGERAAVVALLGRQRRED